jgi:opacity protein-like surface antigen
MRRTVSTALILATFAAAPAAAQVGGLPVFNSGVNSGISLNFDYGMPNEVAGEGKSLGFTGGAALGPIGFTATYASHTPDGADAQSWLGATANLKMFGGPLIPISVNGQVGIGYASVDVGAPEDMKIVEIPVGVGIALNIPTPGVSIKPWIAPRLQYHRTSGAADDSETNFGISAGVNFGLVGGLNARIAYDYLNVDTPSGDKPATLSIGVGYNFNVPVVPGI